MDSFEQRKKDVLGKIDKSAKGSWDYRVVKLIDKLNSMENFYTTSSCSGKCVILEEKTGKDGSYYLWESHEELDLEGFKKIIGELSAQPTPPILSKGVNGKVEGIIKFKLQSPVIFIACRDLNSAEELFSLVREAGFKESGIHITKKLIGIEVRTGEKVEFPLIDSEKVLVDEEFLRVLVKEANKKLKVGWEKLERLGKEL